jgi:polyferredoxin
MVIIPAFLPCRRKTRTSGTTCLFAQFCFWGLWWPGVMIATVTWAASGAACSARKARLRMGEPVRARQGLPRWLKWSGWPFVAFICTTVYGQLVSVYEYPQAALLVLGGSTVAAIGIGLLYGREKRIWCRYLCPASGVFAVLAKIAPLHYKVDRAAWDRHRALRAGQLRPAARRPPHDQRLRMP